MPREIERREIVVEATELRAEGDGRTLKGTVVPYNKIADLGYFKEQVAPGAFKNWIADPKNNVRGLYHHDAKSLLASTANDTLKLIDSERALEFEMEVAKTSYGDDVLALVRSGEIRGMSFGFRIVEEGQRFENQNDGVLRTIVEAELPEITVTSIPAYTSTNVSARSVDQAAIDAARSCGARPERRQRRRRLRRLMAAN